MHLVYDRSQKVGSPGHLSAPASPVGSRREVADLREGDLSSPETSSRAARDVGGDAHQTAMRARSIAGGQRPSPLRVEVAGQAERRSNEPVIPSGSNTRSPSWSAKVRPVTCSAVAARSMKPALL